MAIFLLFEVGMMKYVWPGIYRRPSSSAPASKNQLYQGTGLHKKFEATVRKVGNKMLANQFSTQNQKLPKTLNF